MAITLITATGIFHKFRKIHMAATLRPEEESAN
jgi:hypothetical protein